MEPMKLYFLRHGIAFERSTWEQDDTRRPLTEEGIEKMKHIAGVLAESQLEIELILTSPLVRAKQTAEIVAEKLNVQLLEDARLAPGFDLKKLGSILLDHPNVETLMVVGHEPDFSNTISALIGGGQIVCKKGGLALVEFSKESLKGELLALVPPRLLLHGGRNGS